MNWTRYVAPIASVAVLTIIAALPWGLPAGDRFFLPLLPVVAIHCWMIDRHAWLPEWVVFLAGLTLDILTHGPLGYWALIYLLAHLFATWSAEAPAEGLLARFARLGLALVEITVVAWAVASIYFFEPLDWVPYAIGAASAGLCALLIVPLIGARPRLEEPARNVRLTRGP